MDGNDQIKDIDMSVKQRIEKAEAEKKAAEEKSNLEKDYLFSGANLSGAGLYDKDLQVALATGKDLDGVDIPNDMPEELNSKNPQKGIER